MEEKPIDPQDTHKNEPHRLNDMDGRLYRRDLASRHIKRFDVLHPKLYRVKQEWEKITEPESKVSKIASHPTIFKKFFMYSLGFAGLAALFALVMFFTGGNSVSTNSIEINVLGNSFAAGGEEVPYEVEVVNKNASPLELADLFVEYDKGGDAGSGASHVRLLNSLGTIGGGKTSTKNIFLTLYGAEGSIKNVDFTLQYRIHGSNAVFVKKTTFPVTISSAPLALTVDAPKSTSPNQMLTFTTKIKSNAKNKTSGVLVRIEYPNGFKFANAIPSPTSFDNIWDIGDLNPGDEKTISVSGMVYGQDGEDRGFHVYAGAKSAQDGTKIGVTYNSLLQVVSLVKPFLAADLQINGSSENTVPVSSDSTVLVSVNWANNLSTRITNAEISVSFSGNGIDLGTLVTKKGFYNSGTSTIVWDKTTAPELANIEPGDNGSLDFSFRTSALWKAGQQVLANPTVKFAVSIKGKQASTGGLVSDISNFEEKIAVISSDLGFSQEAYYYSGPFTNTGSIPPKANEPTTYTVTWSLTNSSNPLSGALVTSTLPTYVDWVGTISPSSENVQYDATTRMVTWSAGQIAQGAGLSGNSKSVSFQVRFTPSTSQVGSTPKLLLESKVSATDTFTGAKLTTGRGAISTLLSNDGDFPEGGQIVTN